MNYLHFSSPPINEVINQNSQIWNEACLFLKEGNKIYSENQFKKIDDFWLFKKGDYPNLYEYYCYLKKIPCTNISVERSFSMYKDFYKPRRMKLKEENAEMLYFLKFNKI
jgi:hypothetical protein